MIFVFPGNFEPEDQRCAVSSHYSWMAQLGIHVYFNSTGLVENQNHVY